jgi:hypothetical protein
MTDPQDPHFHDAIDVVARSFPARRVPRHAEQAVKMTADPPSSPPRSPQVSFDRTKFVPFAQRPHPNGSEVTRLVSRPIRVSEDIQ